MARPFDLLVEWYVARDESIMLFSNSFQIHLLRSKLFLLCIASIVINNVKVLIQEVYHLGLCNRNAPGTPWGFVTENFVSWACIQLIIYIV